ncbi:MAG: hypothetical protein DI626_02905 [Micavibrio aeruginosavorus]|uniref:Lipoprotein n=1 Tax=Micavibrio aeruginosavorus TaxID=349221 RepID=A0A2W5A319_9BACT|nr:MAG: hypothetical protein DI626_02905 [Micavibrio aeruginosavorus]
MAGWFAALVTPRSVPYPLRMRLFRFALSLTALFMLAGCSTFAGLQDDFSKGYANLSESIGGVLTPPPDPVKEQKKRLPVYDGTCPQVSARPDLTRLVDFHTSGSNDPSNIASEVEITNVRNTCRVENGALVMQIDIDLSGKTGPKARIKSNDQPNFAYPYFVAVTDNTGIVLSKEIFAAPMSYGRKENANTHTETIFQNMPFPDAASGKTYNVVVGFQLDETQLAYNRINP